MVCSNDLKIRSFCANNFIFGRYSMSCSARIFFIVVYLGCALNFYSQELPAALAPDPALEKMYFPYLAVRHGGPAQTLKWKESNTMRYYQELWYYSKSFSVKRNHFSEGVPLLESIIDISRFESQRKATEEAIVVLPGFRDVLVLVPIDKLIHHPEYVKQ